MYVRCVDNLADLQHYQTAWDTLAHGCVFRSWTWLSAWWRHYGHLGGRRELRVFLVFAEETAEPTSLVGVLPCYLESSWAQGRVLHLLGDGEVCSDHLGWLAASDAAAAAREPLAAHLAGRDDWDLLDLSAVDSADAVTIDWHKSLSRDHCTTSSLLADRTWAIDLPPTWDDFLAMQSKSHRKQLRQMETRVLGSTRADWQGVTSSAAFASAWSTLVDLHQRRRISLGEPGCFASRRWAAFHWEVAQQLLDQGRLRLSVLNLDGRPVAAEYHLAGSRATYAYQGGVEPERLDDEPGQLSTLCAIRRAIAEGHAQFDLLRGDEPYKAHWRATPRQALRLIAVPARTWPKLRRTAWTGARAVVAGLREAGARKNPGSQTPATK